MFFYSKRERQAESQGVSAGRGNLVVCKIQLLKFIWALCSLGIFLICLHVLQKYAKCNINRHQETIFFFISFFSNFYNELYIQLYMNVTTISLQNWSFFFLLYPQELALLRGATQNQQRHANRIGLKFYHQHWNFYISCVVYKFKIMMMNILLN